MVVLTREQLEERLAVLHRASLELVQDISLESLLERIAMVACEQVGARYAAVGVMDTEGRLEQFIPIGMSPAEIQAISHQPLGLGLIGALMDASQPIRLAAIAADPRSAGFPVHHPPMTSFLGVPIRLGERQLGQIYLTNKIEAAEFSRDDEQVIETLAAYAAVAISNARLYKDLRQRDLTLTRRNENLALLNHLATILASSPEINEILDTALTRVVEYLGVEAGEIFLREEDGRSLYLALEHSDTLGPLWTRQRFLMKEGLIGATARSGQIQVVKLPKIASLRFLHKAVVTACVRQIACFPMTGRSGVLGVLCIATCNPQPFDDMEMQLLTSIASWAGTAVENVHLNIQGRRLAVLEERERIGMDLHDGIIQSIYAVGLTLEHARLLLVDDKGLARGRIEQAIAGLNSSIRDIRAYIMDLRPRQLHEENLMDGLQRLVKEFSVTTSIEVVLKGSPEKLGKLPDTQAIVLFHIGQEALANVAKHSHARRVDIQVWVTKDRVLLEMHDDGRGFNLEQVNLTIGHGLANMQTRARNVGGDVEITSEPDKGTTILAWVPLFPSQSVNHMTDPNQSKARAVQDIFTRIASRYDLMNRLMSLGQDRGWRRSAIRQAALPPGGYLLDLGCGTGDMSIETLRQYPLGRVLALDFTPAMMQAGRRRAHTPHDWTAGDALRLPLPDAAFDVVVSAFLLRNVADLQQALKEQYRVLKPGGRWIALDATRPGNGFFSLWVNIYLHRFIPLLGRIITGQGDAYAYLPVSMEKFVRAEELAARAAAAGFREIMFRRMNFSTMAAHWGIK